MTDTEKYVAVFRAAAEGVMQPYMPPPNQQYGTMHIDAASYNHAQSMAGAFAAIANVFQRIADAEGDKAPSPPESADLMCVIEKLQRDKRNLTKLLDDQLGTPCEQIRHQQEIERLRMALANLVYRLDCHFGAGSGDWKEQEEARAVLKERLQNVKFEKGLGL